MKNTLVKLLAGIVIFGLFAGCAGSKVRVDLPPRFDVSSYASYGIVQINSTGEEKLGEMATQKFMQYMLQGSKPGVIVLELGSEPIVLAAVAKKQFDPESVKKICEKYKVNALIIGAIDVAMEKVNVKFGMDLASLKAQSSVKVTMNAKIFEATRGATVWTNSQFGTWKMSGITADSNGLKSINVTTDRETKYEKIVDELAFAITRDFRPSYEMRKVEK